ncbi:polyadenylate-binding protein 7 [Citrus sinensis]|uniref:Polyadenylate-binding protein 7 n=1 Tax=Citrus sinensis TaxID=2711 RepID=A0ACB8ISY3_CITSI|nr:polyadenylate-binding protein 7 [Citrus sinensis]
MWSTPNSEARLSGIGNAFVKKLNIEDHIQRDDHNSSSDTWQNLASTIDNLKLHQIFSKFGDIQSSKVVVSQEGKSKGYGFVQYSTPESALDAIEKLQGATVERMELYVGPFIRRADRIQEGSSFNNLYVKNLDDDMTEEILVEKFSEFGKITSLVISKDANGTSKGSKVLYVARAQKKAERKAILRAQFERMRKERAELYKAPDSVTQYRGAMMNGHANFPMPLMLSNLQKPSYNYPISQPRAGQAAANNLTNGNHRAAASNENLSSMLVATSPDERKDILGQRLYPLVKKLKVEALWSEAL